jgi:hypothetical protein
LIRAGWVPQGATPNEVDAEGNVGPHRSPFLRAGEAIVSGLQEYQKQQQQKDERVKFQGDLYNSLRDAGYDPKSAHDAVQKWEFPSQPGGQTLKEKQAEQTTTNEAYRVNREARLQRQNDIANLKTFGGTVSDDDVQAMGVDLESYVKAGGGQAYLDAQGKRQYRIIPFETFQRNVAAGKWTDTEIEKFRTPIVENQRWSDVLTSLGDLGIGEQNLSSLGRLEFEPTKTPFGPVSLPARFNLAAQYLTDPRYTAIKRKVEMAFQAMRTRITGAQASDKEIQRLRDIMPMLKDRPEVFFTTVRAIMDQNQKEMLEQKNMYEAFGRDTTHLDQYLATLTQPNPMIAAPMTPATSQGNEPSFASEAEAEAANLPKGTIILIGGRRARVK